MASITLPDEASPSVYLGVCVRVFVCRLIELMSLCVCIYICYMCMCVCVCSHALCIF